MKKIFVLILSTFFTSAIFASVDSVVVPIYRQIFHDDINKAQKDLDKADGKIDGKIRVSTNEDINLAVTDVWTRRIDELQNTIEQNTKIPANNEKVRYLRYTESLLKAFRINWRSKQFNPVYSADLLNNFINIMNANIDGVSMAKFIGDVPYQVAKINTEIFTDNKGYKESRNIVFLKFCEAFPDRILLEMDPYVNEPYADSLLVVSANLSPSAVYTKAQAVNTPVGRLIHKSTNPVISQIAALSKMPDGLWYFPFLDDILNKKITVDDIKKTIGSTDNGYDSVAYYKLLVQTEISYYKRMTAPAKDTPIAMFGANGLRDVLFRKANQHFITQINELHEKPENIRMRAVDPLSPVDLYYMMVMGENDIYTSSYKNSFNRFIQRMGKTPRTDSLLENINFDYFKKFIKMAANFNKLDTFLKFMPPAKAESLMQSFVANLDKTNNLEDAVDVADCYSSINDKKLLQTILGYVIANEKIAIDNYNERGKTIYGLLKTIFLSADSTNNIDLTSAIGIPPIYTIDNKALIDDSSRIIEQVFFFGDEDGKNIFNGFLGSFSPKEWKITPQKEWVEIKSLKGQKVWIYANRPLDNNKNLDDSAQTHLNKYLYDNDLNPSVVVHRGHSYWLPYTIKRMPDNAKIVMLGSCGGYKNLSTIIKSSPDAHIISTKEIGSGFINKPILTYLNQSLLSGKTIVWKTMWSDMTKQFEKLDRGTRDTWDDYIPPYKNLGAIFLKAYNKKMAGE